jgi:NTP pyrophosphatase (non-canonical NTP hydrolase)
MAQLTEEVGEVARIIAVVTGNNQKKESDKTRTLAKNSRCGFVVMCLANQTELICKQLLTRRLI